MINAVQKKAQIEQQAKQQNSDQLVQGLGAIGQVGQSLVDKRLRVAQSLALGKTFGMSDAISRNLNPEQVIQAHVAQKGYIDPATLWAGLHAMMGGTPPATQPPAASGTTAPSDTATPASAAISAPAISPAAPNGAILASDQTATPVPVAAMPTPTAPSQADAPVPIAAPPATPRMVNPAEAKMLMDIAKANRETPVMTQSEALKRGSVSHGTHIIATQNSAANTTWDTASDSQKSLAKAMYEGRVRPSDLSFRDRGATTSLANEYATQNGLPPFRAYAGDVNANMAKYSTTGKMGQNALSLNTALGHAASAYDSYQAIQNTNQNWLNTPINKLKKATNDPNVVALGINLNALQGELANVFKNSGATDQEISHWREYLSENLTPSQYVGALSKVDDLLKSRLNAMEYQRGSTGSGGPALISPHAKEISNRLSGQQETPANANWAPESEQRLQMLLEKKAKGTLKS